MKYLSLSLLLASSLTFARVRLENTIEYQRGDNTRTIEMSVELDSKKLFFITEDEDDLQASVTVREETAEYAVLKYYFHRKLNDGSQDLIAEPSIHIFYGEIATVYVEPSVSERLSVTVTASKEE